MLYGTLPGSELPASRLIQGTAMLTSERLDWSFGLLDAVFELGGNVFDTAHGYGHGDVERTVGRWMRERGNRDKLVIIGKGCHHNQDRKRVTPHDISSDVMDSLARFKIDYIDLYLLHRDDPTVPVGPLVETLNEHLRAGRFRAFGVSNWTPERIQEANRYAEERGLQTISASSPNFSLAKQSHDPWPDCISISDDQQAQDWYRQTGMPVIAWSSLSGGFFSGRFRPDNLNSFSSYWDQICADVYGTEANFRRLERAKVLADESGMSIAQVALAYVVNQPFTVFPVVGCHTGAEFKANLEACSLKLDEATLDWLDLKRDSR